MLKLTSEVSEANVYDWGWGGVELDEFGELLLELFIDFTLSDDEVGDEDVDDEEAVPFILCNDEELESSDNELVSCSVLD